MKRRNFIKSAALGGVLPTVVNGLSLQAVAATPMLQALANAAVNTDHVLVIIQMGGGNDGLNMVLPLDQYSKLSVARANILVPDTKALKLNGVTGTGLHPAMTEMQTLFNAGKLRILQGVSYPQPDFSHFRATDIWMTGSDSTQVLTTGWAGRYLNAEFANYPVGYPNATMTDPLAIQLGTVVSETFQGPVGPMGIALTNPTSVYNIANNITDPAPAGYGGHELTFIRNVERQAAAYSGVVSQAFLKGSNAVTYPAKSALAAQLQLVARLVKGGFKTRIYMVGFGSFDTHSSQVDAADHTTGRHAALLAELSTSVGAFQSDIEKLGVQDRVIGMTFSEFGRRIKSNDSLGTDHGAAEPMFVFGTKVKGGMLGTNPVIPAAATSNDNVAMQYDFRSVYASILQNWFCVPTAELNTVLLKNYQSLPILTSTCGTGAGESGSDEYFNNVAAGKPVISSYPNPFTSSTTIDFETQGGHTMVQIFDAQGQIVAVPVDGFYDAGKYKVRYEGDRLPTGLYYIRLQNGAVQQVKSLVKVR